MSVSNAKSNGHDPEATARPLGVDGQTPPIERESPGPDGRLIPTARRGRGNCAAIPSAAATRVCRFLRGRRHHPASVMGGSVELRTQPPKTTHMCRSRTVWQTDPTRDYRVGWTPSGSHDSGGRVAAVARGGRFGCAQVAIVRRCVDMRTPGQIAHGGSGSRSARATWSSRRRRSAARRGCRAWSECSC
jgi:hypothetical protein